ncbi:nucleoside/nucleotide kinase family protein [Sphingopyxis yananensis]|uniref:nucleoside triphosphate hydrolase n=1 Tax=Sphingopyxis yananensis TaxID=2886687 RepID=UPI001D10A9F7|nr:nucleoside triphosphate hydrolase [Sphingopyxis yananensis]MCC2603175.1 nucleoside triphosphate hydrolase [Sphingopyxis yananensis]
MAKLPLIGEQLDRSIQKKAKTAQTSAGPSPVTAIGIYAFALRRERRFKRMMRLRRAGNLILADRFPQMEVPGSMDGLGLSKAPPAGLQGWLAQKEQMKFKAMVAHQPDLILRLNVSLDIAIARKPDHIPTSLARKIDDLSRISFGDAPLAEINADDPLDTVLTNAKSAISALLEQRYHMPISFKPSPAASRIK